MKIDLYFIIKQKMQIMFMVVIQIIMILGRWNIQIIQMVLIIMNLMPVLSQSNNINW